MTRDQYDAWLATSPAYSGQLPECLWNTMYAPSSSCINLAGPCPGSDCGNYPQICVDWCDAYAFCKGVGKRLCGRIGGGANAYGDLANASLSQWFNACSAGGQTKYPYGDVYGGQVCNGTDAANSGAVAVATMTGCVTSTSGYQGLFDMSGNVWEWEDSCEGTSGALDKCRVRGGSFGYSGYNLTCSYDNYYRRNNTENSSIGFRCCADP